MYCSNEMTLECYTLAFGSNVIREINSFILRVGCVQVVHKFKKKNKKTQDNCNIRFYKNNIFW